MTRSRGWCFTLHDYNNSDESILQSIITDFIIYGREESNSGSPHLQGYIYFKEPGKTSYAVHKIMKKAHWTASKGNIDSNIAYCSKLGHTFSKG